MKWHDHILSWPGLARGYGGSHEALMISMGKRIGAFPDSATNIAFLNSRAHIAGERRWEEARRPYYNVYPSVVEAFTKVDLDKVLCDHIKLPMLDLLIRFAVGGEIQTADGTRVNSILVSESIAAYDHNLRGMVIGLDDGKRDEEGLPNTSTTCIVLAPGTTVQSGIDKGRSLKYTRPDAGINDEAVDLAFRLICSLCLLRDQPDLIEPEPLEADRTKWERNHDPKLLEKASRRGKRAWAVGKHIEAAPGFRRPHFAIRWMGHGEPKVPTLRPIRGCLVRRKKLEEMPTGYLDSPIEAIVED